MIINVDTGFNKELVDISLDNNRDNLNVELSKEIELDVDIGISSQSLSCGLNENAFDLDIDMYGGGINTAGKYPAYKGPYIVDPRKQEQVLATNQKNMEGDVIINPIYYAETSNEGGGYTAVIGLE